MTDVTLTDASGVETFRGTATGVGPPPYLAITAPTDLNGQEGTDGLPLLCDLWLDASDAATIHASAGLVSRWDDKSGEGNDAVQATGANKPTTGATTIGGLNALSFDGAAAYLDSPAVAYAVSPASNATGTFTYFVVFAPGAVDLDSFNYALVGDTTDGSYLQLDNSASEPQLQGGEAAISLTTFAGAHIASWSGTPPPSGLPFNEVSLVSWDRVTAIAEASPDASADTVRVGAASGPDRFWLGGIGAVIHFAGTCDSFQRAQVLNLLAAQWRLA